MTRIEEKARDIVIKMQFQKEPLNFEQARQCALICVKEMINALEALAIAESGTIKIDYGQSFLESLKIEIENL